MTFSEMMALLVSCLLLFPCYSSSASSEVVVSQSQDVTVVEGDTVEIRCSWTSKSERIWVSWMKNKTEMNKMLFNGTSKSSLLTLKNIRKDHSGTYICKVSAEIPFYVSVEGIGTVITVVLPKVDPNDHKEDKNNAGSHSPEVFIQVLRYLPLVTLVGIFLYLYKSLIKNTSQENKPTTSLREEVQEEVNEFELVNVVS